MGGVLPETCWALYKYEITFSHCELYYDARIHEHQTVNFVWTILTNSNQLRPVHGNTTYDCRTYASHFVYLSYRYRQTTLELSHFKLLLTSHTNHVKTLTYLPFQKRPVHKSNWMLHMPANGHIVRLHKLTLILLTWRKWWANNASK